MKALEIGHIAFKWPLVLLLLPLLWIILYWLNKKRQRSSGIILPTFQSVSQQRNFRTILTTFLPCFKYAALSLLIIACAYPQKILTEEIIKSDGIGIALVIDLSSSMLAKDFNPNRLEVTKSLAIDFVNKRPNDRISLSVFAGEAFALSPLTTDHRVVKNLLQELQQGNLEDGTAIGMGLASGINRLKDSEIKSKVIILLTDGVNNAGYLDPLTSAKLASDLGIKVYVIGVGSQGMALLPISRSASGQFIYGYSRVEIDEALMTKIANLTQGQYFRATDETSLQQIYEKINSLEKTKIEKNIKKKNLDYFRPFLLASILLFLLEILLKNTWLKSPIFIE